MSSSAEVFAQLGKWKIGPAKLYMSWAISGVSGWCIGVLKHVASSELHSGIDTIDRKDFLFVINVHSTYQPQFRFVDNRDAWQFFAPQRERSEFGKTLEIMGSSPSMRRPVSVKYVFLLLGRSRPLVLFHWREYGVQKIGCRLDSLQVRIAESAVVIQGQGDELLASLQEKLDGRLIVLGVNDGFAEGGNAEGLVIHALQLHLWSHTCLECRTIPPHVGDTSGLTTVAIIIAGTALHRKPN